jgi:hypothetical protein
MRRLLSVAAALMVVSICACRRQQEPRATSSFSPTASEAPAPAPVQPGTVMTDADMERFRQERKALINRPTPLGEEFDPR